MKNILELKSVSKSYPGFSLKNISFNLPYGYIMGLIGPNGAGKTTIIKLIMNLIMKNGGQILVFGKEHQKFEAEIKERVGFVYEIPAFYENLRLFQTIAILAPFYSQWDGSRFERYTQQFQLPLDKKFKQLSKGMKMKFAIAFALSHHADLIILDEPTSGLDPVFRRTFLMELSDIIQDEKKGVLYSTHITSDLEKTADYVTLINDGEIIFSDKTDDILNHWKIIRAARNFNFPDNIEVKGMYRKEFGMDALVANAGPFKNNVPEGVVVERATLEDIMFLLNGNNTKDTNLNKNRHEE